MSVVVKDMAMPETCEECNFHCYNGNGEYICVATPMFYPFNLANSKGIRKDWCPLVEVPAPHGRLIDADALIARMESDAEQMEEPIAQMFTYAAINDVKHSETVIEAERRTDATN